MAGFFQWMYRWSWNPFFGAILASISGGAFALLGAVIGGRYVIQSMMVQRHLDRIAAGRALSAELQLNLATAVALATSGRTNPRDYLVFRPPLHRSAFDDRLALLSELLTPHEFFQSASVYARASASFLELEGEALRGAEFTPEAEKTFTALAEEFAVAAGLVAARVWPEAEQQRLKLVRDKELEKLRGTPGKK